MNLLSDVITYIRRIIKAPSNASITDELLIDYINRFWIMDVDARMQHFDLKTKYQFQTTPGVDQYNMPLYDLQLSPTPTQESPVTNSIASYPVYQGFLGPAYINGVPVSFNTEKANFNNWFPNYVQNFQAVGVGDGGPTYTLQVPILPQSSPPNPPLNGILRGHIDIAGIIAIGNNVDPPVVSTLNLNVPTTSVDAKVFITSIDERGANVVVTDSGQFYDVDVNKGLLLEPGKAPLGNKALPGGYRSSFNITGASQAVQAVLTVTSSYVVGQLVTINNVVGMVELNGNTYTVVGNTGALLTINVNSLGFTPYISGGTVSSLNNLVNYLTGEINVTFPVNIPVGNNINVQCYFFQSGLPRSILYYNNTLTLRSPPALQYLVELDAYLTPAAFLNTASAVPFAYMSEYIARGAARKILSDTGDVEQLQFYEPFFREQELLVWKRSQRQWTSTRTQTIYSQGLNQGQLNLNNNGGATT